MKVPYKEIKKLVALASAAGAFADVREQYVKAPAYSFAERVSLVEVAVRIEKMVGAALPLAYVADLAYVAFSLPHFDEGVPESFVVRFEDAVLGRRTP